MMTFERLKQYPRVFHSMTGLTLEMFEQLLPTFSQAYQHALDQKHQQQKRQRQPGGGRKPVLQGERDKLVFILFYFRQYPTQEALAFLFGMSQGQANVWIHRLTPVLNQTLSEEQQLPARKPQKVKDLLQQCEGLQLIIDGVERPIRRPGDPEGQKADYSGKKKRHTKKNIVVTEKKTGKIQALTETQPGSKHDKKCIDESQYSYPEGSTLWQDTGFQGYKPEGVKIKQPKKKPRGGQLTEEQKAANRDISRERIGVEHSIGGVKVFRIIADTFRNTKEGFVDAVMVIACGLFNLRVDARLAANG